MQDCTLK